MSTSIKQEKTNKHILTLTVKIKLMEGLLLFPFHVRKGVLWMRDMIKPFFNMFGRKRNSRGAMWASLLGLGISAAVFGLTRGKRINNMQPIQNLVQSFTPKTNFNQMNNAALTEFSEELLESALRNDKNR
jgi:hypothetical protein